MNSVYYYRTASKRQLNQLQKRNKQNVLNLTLKMKTYKIGRKLYVSVIFAVSECSNFVRQELIHHQFINFFIII